MRKVLVTGATGFLGNYIIRELLKNKYTVIATSAHPTKALASTWYNEVMYIPLDFSQLDPAENYYTYFSKPDLMIHLAWEGLPNYKASFHTEKNLPLQKAFLKNIVANGLQDLTVTGTCLEYGMQEGSLREDMAVYPGCAYAIAKDELRKFLEQVKMEFHFLFKWVRLFYMFGEGQGPNSLLSQLNKAILAGNESFNMSGGEQVRDFLPVQQVAAYIVSIAAQKEITGIINCASNQPVTVKSFVENYLKTINKQIALNLGYYPYLDYEPMRFWGDNAKLENILQHE